MEKEKKSVDERLKEIHRVELIKKVTGEHRNKFYSSKLYALRPRIQDVMTIAKRAKESGIININFDSVTDSCNEHSFGNSFGFVITEYGMDGIGRKDKYSICGDCIRHDGKAYSSIGTEEEIEFVKDLIENFDTFENKVYAFIDAETQRIEKEYSELYSTQKQQDFGEFKEYFKEMIFVRQERICGLIEMANDSKFPREKLESFIASDDSIGFIMSEGKEIAVGIGVGNGYAVQHGRGHEFVEDGDPADILRFVELLDRFERNFIYCAKSVGIDTRKML